MGGTAPLILAATATAATTYATQKMTTKKAPSQNEDYNRQLAELSRKQNADANARKDRLARASGSYRARMAARGINVRDGSSQAVLNGLKSKTDQELDLLSAEYDDRRFAAKKSFASVQDENMKQRSQSSDLLKSQDNTVRLLRAWD